MRKGALKKGLDPTAAADIVWLLGPGTYNMLVHRRGWSPGQFQTWLTETFIGQLLPPSPRPDSCFSNQWWA